jgi:hypothetical protein
VSPPPPVMDRLPYGQGVVPAMEGSVIAFRQSALERTGLGVESLARLAVQPVHSITQRVGVMCLGAHL